MSNCKTAIINKKKFGLNLNFRFLLFAEKKIIFLMAVPLRGGELKRLPLRKKILFWGDFRLPLSSRGGGSLNGTAIKKNSFF